MVPGIGSLAFDSLGGAGGLANNGIASTQTGAKTSTLNFGNIGGNGFGKTEMIWVAGISAATFLGLSALRALRGGK